MAIPREYSKSMTLKQLTDRCNQDENNLTAMLTSLKVAKNRNGTDITKGAYEEQDDFEGLGNLTIEEFSSAKEGSAEFSGQAFVDSVRKKVLVFRS